MRPLQQLQVKIHRSADHLRDLENELNAYLRASPVKLDYSLEAESAAYVFKVSALDEVPLRARILAGEVLTHLRSTLDHLVWQLALLETPLPNEKSEFPIFLSAEAFRKAITTKIGSISHESQRIIEELQPFKGTEPKKTALWRLHRLANIDKHRLTTVVVSSLTGMGVQWLEDGMSVETRIGPLSVGMEIGKIDCSGCKESITDNLPNQVGPAIQVLPCLQLEGDDSILPVIPTLHAFGVEVESIVRRFEASLQ